jgi:hypothetical protein
MPFGRGELDLQEHDVDVGLRSGVGKPDLGLQGFKGDDLILCELVGFCKQGVDGAVGDMQQPS